MKTKMNGILFFLILAAFSTSALAKSKGDSAREFLLTGDDGSTWEVRSSRVPLAEHVGHTVTAIGVVSNAKCTT
jgi:hypothetical protein